VTPEQNEYFMAAVEKLIDSADRLTSTEFRTGILLLSVAMFGNGYANFSHEEAGLLCGTDKNATMRAHLIHLRDAGVLSDYSTNGTVRVKFAAYSGREMIVHRRSNSLAEPTNSLAEPTNSLAEPTNSLAQPTVANNDSDSRALSQLLRALRSRDRALSQQFSRNFDDQPSTKLVSKLDLNTPTEKGTDLLTATAIDPVEHALSVAFLVSAGFWAKTAKELAGRHRFELLRRAVGFWWSNRRSNGGEFSDKPGIVLTWLANLENTVIPEKLSMDFMLSDLYMNHLTADERAAMAQDEADSEQYVDGAALEEDDQPWPEMNEFWAVALERMRAELPATTFNTWMEGSRAKFDDSALTCTVIVDSQTKRDWLNARLRQMITREVRKSTGYNLAVTIEVRRRS